MTSMPSRSGKRQKRADDKNATPIHEYTNFTLQARKRGIEINGVQAACIPGAGLGLRATRSIRVNERLMFIPAAAMFGPDEKLLIEHSLHRSTSPQAQLAVSALVHFRESPDEFLDTWQATWPTEQDLVQSMPMCWTASVQEMLPPAVHFPLKRILTDFAKDWSSVQSFCLSRAWSEDLFRYFWLIVNSRSFHWKPVSPSKSRSGARRRVLRAELPGSMVMCPFLDLMNHGPSLRTVCVYQRPNGYEVVSDRVYEAGEEILATYGAHSNDRLLVHYGFILDPKQNHDNDVRLDHIILPVLTPTVKEQLQDLGFLGGYALLPSKNELCFKTQVALRAILLTNNEWEHFVQNGEDLGDDREASINAFVRPLLQAFHRETKLRLDDVAKCLEWKDSELTAKRLILGQWQQILTHLETYLQ